MQNRDWNALLAEPDVGVPKLVATATTPAKNSNSTKSGKETKQDKDVRDSSTASVQQEFPRPLKKSRANTVKLLRKRPSSVEQGLPSLGQWILKPKPSTALKPETLNIEP